MDAVETNKYKLYYFNMKGKGEPIRLIFAYAEVPFEDFRINRNTEWPTWKSKVPWGQVPILEVTPPIGDTLVLAQTNAICRFIAKKYHLIGENDIEEAKCNELIDAMNDYTNEWLKCLRLPENDATRPELFQKCLNIHTPHYLERFSKIKEKNPGKWIIGSKITWADIYIFATLRNLEERATSNLLDNYPILQEFQLEVSKLPNINKFLQSIKY